jgi:molybdopterin synthase sulfur carrier subunit
MISVLFFARLREELGEAKVELDEGMGALTVSAVIDKLATGKGAKYQDVLRADNVIYAVNQTVVELDHPVVSGDEVAFYPPVTGG